MAMKDWIHAAIMDERERQSAKWGKDHPWGSGDCSSNNVSQVVKSAVLQEECGEVARAVLDADPGNLREELVQVAAVAVSWLESMGEK